MIYYIVVLSDGKTTEIMEPIIDRNIQPDRQFFEKRYSGWISIGYRVQHFCKANVINIQKFNSDLFANSSNCNICGITS